MNKTFFCGFVKGIGKASLSGGIKDSSKSKKFNAKRQNNPTQKFIKQFLIFKMML